MNKTWLISYSTTYISLLLIFYHFIILMTILLLYMYQGLVMTRLHDLMNGFHI